MHKYLILRQPHNRRITTNVYGGIERAI